MLASIEHGNRTLKVDLSKPLDISVAVGPNGPRAWFVEEARISPVINQHFTGSVKLGGNVNFKDIYFNPHGHGTHTESVGHIANENVFIDEALKQYFFIARLVSVTPELVVEDAQWRKMGDHVITKSQLQPLVADTDCEALIVRTLPNQKEKRSKNYSNTNFCYLDDDALAWLAAKGIQHLLVDLPSVDRESDGGMLKGHRAFWNYPNETRKHCTITEFVFVPDEIIDGEYFLNLQVSSFENDAAPSRPLLFPIL